MSFREISKIISETFGKRPEIFLEISGNNKNFENYKKKFFNNFRKFRGLLRRIKFTEVFF